MVRVALASILARNPGKQNCARDIATCAEWLEDKSSPSSNHSFKKREITIYTEDLDSLVSTYRNISKKFI
jgi:hypothetical protein